MKGKKIAGTLCIILVAAMLSSCAFAPKGGGSTDLTQNLRSEFKGNIITGEELEACYTAAADFSLRLFRESLGTQGDNALVSPISVLAALGMTANGAAGETLQEMEAVFGISVRELNGFMRLFAGSFDGDNSVFSMANSIWLKDDKSLDITEDFLQTNKNFYNAEIYKSAFDNKTLKDVNSWVSKKTNGMIKDILGEISPTEVMYLINALTFQAKWERPYYESQVEKGIFYQADGTEKPTNFMHSTEHSYLSDGNARGFMKPYEGGKYSFVALLPNEGISVTQYLKTLTGESLQNMIKDAADITVYANLPKFEYEYQIQMKPALEVLGIEKAFDPYSADFSAMGTSANGNLFISSVIHKTYICVAEEGTKAGAATIVAMDVKGMPVQTQTVTLDRPFVYMILDTETNVPLFIGTLNEA